jgi:hypothetical protein
MKGLEELIVKIMSKKRIPLDTKLDYNIKFDPNNGVFRIEGNFKVPDTNIPMDNMEGRLLTTFTLTLYDIQLWVSNKTLNL